MRYTNLQAGRFAAAAAVVWFHAGLHGRSALGVPTWTGDPVPAYLFRTAVIFFFVLSGFVLAHGLQTAPLGRFLVSRLLRLYPAYLAAAGAVLLVRWAAGNPYPVTGKPLVYGLLLWPGGPGKVAYTLGIEWTLVYEVFLSLAVVPLAALGRRWGLGLGTTAWLAVIVGKEVVRPAAGFVAFPRPGEIALAMANAPFLLGVLAYLAHRRLAGYRAWGLVLVPVAFVGGSACVESAVNWSYLAQSAAAAALVGVVAAGSQLDPRNVFVTAGDWSYGIYLMHAPVMIGFYALAAGWGWPATDRVVALGGFLALAVGAVYGQVEWAAYRRMRRVVARPKADVIPFADRRAA